jgi:hypothetical protein
MRSFTEFGDPTIGMYVILIIIGIIMVQFIDRIHTYPQFETHRKICLAKCDKPICTDFVKKSKGDNYYLDNTRVNTECLFTIWEFSHVIFHAFIGYFFNLHTSLGIGIPWELSEHYGYRNCGNIMDIFWNMVGYSIGYGLKYATHG